MAAVVLLRSSGSGGDGFEKRLSACGVEVVGGREGSNGSVPVVVVAESVTAAVAKLSEWSGGRPALARPPLLVLTRRCLADAFAAGRAGFAAVLDVEATGEEILAALGAPVPPTPPAAGIIGESPPIRNLLSLIDRVADTDTTVLVQGESGTGKELIARALHEKSGRPGSFVAVNCGAIPGELLESELFGHEKGAFTNAVRTRIGRFELADRGTIFLDEISEMPPHLQVKLLRVLQERVFERVGGTRTVSSDFRVIAATNRDLEKEVEEGRFREDLFYRLNVITLEAPPLRDRPGDIPLLAAHFLERFNRTKKRNIKGIDPAAMEMMTAYHWPGNVRELENVIERMVILSTGRTITAGDLPARISEARSSGGWVSRIVSIPEEGISLNQEVAAFEQELIRMALERTGWVKNRAAVLLNLNRTTLLEKMKRYGMNQPGKAGSP